MAFMEKIMAARNRTIFKMLKKLKIVRNILWYFLNLKKKSGHKLRIKEIIQKILYYHKKKWFILFVH